MNGRQGIWAATKRIFKQQGVCLFAGSTPQTSSSQRSGDGGGGGGDFKWWYGLIIALGAVLLLAIAGALAFAFILQKRLKRKTSQDPEDGPKVGSFKTSLSQNTCCIQDSTSISKANDAGQALLGLLALEAWHVSYFPEELYWGCCRLL